MEKTARLRLVVEPNAEKFDALTDALKRLGTALDELNAKGTLSVEIDLSIQRVTDRDKSAA